MKNKVILVNPGVHFQRPVTFGMYPNTAIMVLSTILHNAGFQVKIIDGRYINIDTAIRQILAEINEKLIFIGFSVMTMQAPWAYFVSKGIKSKHPNAKIVWGGIHATLFPEQTVEDSVVDLVTINDAASTIIPLALALSKGDDLSNIHGVCYKHNSEILKTSLGQHQDNFDNVPFINFSLMDHKRYSKNNVVAMEEFYGGQFNDTRLYPIITGLGCVYKCSFCVNVILKKGYRYRQADEIIERIKYLQRNYNADFIHPLDENFFISKERIFKFIDLLDKEKIKIKWRPLCRADYFNDDYINIEVAKRLERAGMVVAAIGAESASQRILNKINKKLKVEHIKKSMEILSRTNIIPKLNFMVGIPGETEQDIKKTFQFAMGLREKYKRSCITINAFRPYPGSPLYEQIITEYNYSPPSSLKEWVELSESEFLEGEGYESYEKYKWIKNSKRLRAMLWIYNRAACYKPFRDNVLFGRLGNFIIFIILRLNISSLFYSIARFVKSFIFMRKTSNDNFKHTISPVSIDASAK